MKDKEPIVILLVLFVLLGLAYGPYKQNAIKNESNSSIGSPNQYDQSSLGYTPNKTAAENIKEVEQQIKKLEQNIAKNNSSSNTSPYNDLVTMSMVNNLNNSDPGHEYIRLSTYLQKNQTIKITGWYLRSEKTGNTVVIGGASLLPFPFSKTYQDVVLQYQDSAYIIKGFSPIGISFRTNKCTGYFEENAEFWPTLPTQCPLVTDTDLPTFSSINERNDDCLELLERIPRCTTVKNSYLRDLPDSTPSSCKAYMEVQATYKACVANHFSDTDFPGNQYYIYLNKFGPLWRDRNEKLTLYDNNGLVVDSMEW